MRAEIRNQMTMLGNPVATEVERRRSTHRRWLHLDIVSAGTVALREVEVPARVDPEEWTASPDDDPTTVETEMFDSLDEALRVLEDRGVDTDKFDVIWKFPNPF